MPAIPPIVVMGPSGCGKSTLGLALAAKLDRPFIEGDAHHPASNIAKMASGQPLSEPDRKPFLENVGKAIQRAGTAPVASCSALRLTHRDHLRQYAPDLLFVWIDVAAKELAQRVAARTGHFMPAVQLADQIALFEPPTPPEAFILVDGTLPTCAQVELVTRRLAER